MARVVFPEVYLYGEKAGRCQNCGKRRQRRQQFMQTINPFNKNARGQIKSEAEIYDELHAEIVKWQREPIVCCGAAA